MTDQHFLSNESLTSWLSSKSWTEKSTGPMGALWGPMEDSQLETLIGIPQHFETDPIAVSGLLKRLSDHFRMSELDIRNEIEFRTVDISRFAINVNLEKSLGVSTAPLSDVSRLFSGTGRIFRAASITCQSPTEVIGDAFPASSKRLFHKIQAGFTEQGSYVLPVYVEVGDPQTSHDLSGQAHVVPTEYRKVTQTVALAFEKMFEKVIDPNKEPTSRDAIRDLVESGISKEFLTAVTDLIPTDGSDAYAKFQWAPSHSITPEAKNLPTEFVVPNDARDLLTSVSKRFKPTAPEPEPLDGIIKGIIREDNGSVITVMDAHRGGKNPGEGRRATIEVVHHDVDNARLDEFYRWFRASDKVYFQGSVLKQSNRLTIRHPLEFSAPPTLFEDEDGK
ncbi:hypothetical protein PAB09_00130 [Corynebacterium sp. SCR221107]|uniref:hypothetical protein n=1 Tax=Corynebacterium sp. SCR221107 TaxID=3017361 RepID=UPI0022EC74B9|nr:hypothetical protein [Corynebacterium sp. SCR221107]WBT08811.1 hypothetical protein PAB09_00130 [Corynebacterium sp. SCR221107]